MPSYRRKPFPTGRSKGITLPASMNISDEVSIASGERLVLMDTTGEVPEDKLLQFYMEQVEPASMTEKVVRFLGRRSPAEVEVDEENNTDQVVIKIK
jgi:virulence-associated protein VagC